MRSDLTKRDIEELLDAYDIDPTGALTVALSKIVGTPVSGWTTALTFVPESIAPQSRLRECEIGALDAVVKHLVENRRLQK